MYEYPRKPKIWIYVVVAVLSFVLGWQATSYGLLNSSPTEENSHDRVVNVDKDSDENIDLSLFWTVWNEVKDKYYDPEILDSDVMVYGAIKGFVESLEDPFTVFMTPEESADFNASLEGTLEGIGAELTVEDHNLVVLSPLRNSPAERAGLLPGDIIYMIDDEIAAEMTLFEAIMNIRGEKGTTVTLTIIRGTLDEPFDVSIVRDSIDIESVTYEELDGDIVYLSINQFNEKTTDEFSKSISEMLLNEPKGLIIDLRYNGGGYLDISVDLLSYLLPTDEVAVIIQERGKKDDIKNTNGKPKLLNVPLVVLVNEGSASASEIVAGAIQDHERGVIMGTTTFGKGTVQEVDTFADGSSIRMTIANWLTPDRQDIDGVGLTPDMVVEISDEDVDSQYDRQKEEAASYLRNL